MKLEIENTDKIVTLQVNGHDVPARVWQGKTDTGIEVHCYITSVAVKNGQDEKVYEQFQRELIETHPMRPDVQGIPLRMIL